MRYEGDELYLEGRSVQRLAEDLGTPFFLISEARLRGNYAALERGLSRYAPGATLRYCAKTNNEAGVLEILESCGSHLLTSHPAEAELALSCGFTPERIAYQRPVLLEQEVSRLLEIGIRYFHAYRFDDLSLLDSVAAQQGERVAVSLRLQNDATGLSPLSFLSRRLGFHEGEILSLGTRIRDLRSLSIEAVNFYCGTQQSAAARYVGLLRKAVRLTGILRSRAGLPVEEINLGGGVPSRSLRRLRALGVIRRLLDRGADTDTSVSLEDFGTELGRGFQRETAGMQPAVRIGLEPGRSIVGNAGFLVTRVRAAEGSWLFLDASHNYLGESIILFSRELVPARRKSIDRHRFYHLSGSTLNTRDVLDLHRRLPVLSSGDVLVFCDAGAYSISRATRYSGLSPAVYLLDRSGAVRMIRRPESFADFAAPMVRDESMAGSSDRDDCPSGR